MKNGRRVMSNRGTNCNEEDRSALNSNDSDYGQYGFAKKIRTETS